MKRMVVEDCIRLSVFDLGRKGVFSKRCETGWISWTINGVTRRVDFRVLEWPGLAACLRFEDPLIQCSVEVTSTRPYFGGKKHWFLCPLTHNSARCRRRTACLYLPPGQSVFGCRSCYDLTYRSSQTHDKRVSALLQSPLALAAALQSGDRSQNLLGVRAYTRTLYAVATSLESLVAAQRVAADSQGVMHFDITSTSIPQQTASLKISISCDSKANDKKQEFVLPLQPADEKVVSGEKQNPCFE